MELYYEVKMLFKISIYEFLIFFLPVHGRQTYTWHRKSDNYGSLGILQ